MRGEFGECCRLMNGRSKVSGRMMTSGQLLTGDIH